MAVSALKSMSTRIRERFSRVMDFICWRVESFSISSSSFRVTRRSTSSALLPGQMVITRARLILISGSSRRLMSR
jgi:hypothetical protein